MLTRRIAAVLLSIFLSFRALAAPTACPEHFLNGEAPDAVAAETDGKTQELCYAQFAVLHSGVTRTPLWSAEHLTQERIDAAQGQRRVNAFHAEQRLHPDDRAELADFKGSGYDRGHLSPSGDMPDPDSQRESFTLANMIPQDPNNNRGIWARLESAVRELARTDDDVFVVTGPIFDTGDQLQIHERVTVPARLFKAVYDSSRQAAGVYLTDNAPGREWQVISLTELRNLTGMDVFPTLAQRMKDHAMALPNPVRDVRFPHRDLPKESATDRAVNDGDAIDVERRN